MTDRDERWCQRLRSAHGLDDGDRVALVEDGRIGVVECCYMPWETLSCGCCSEPLEDDYHTVDVIWEDDGSETNESIEDLMLVGE